MVSINTNVFQLPGIEIRGIQFLPGAISYTISVDNDLALTLSDFGITQFDPSVVQTINNDPGPNDGGHTHFFNNAAAASVHFNNFGATAANIFAGRMAFFNASSAATSTIVNYAAADPNVAVGVTRFFATATASGATILNNGGEAINRNGGFTEFNEGSNAGNATIGNHANLAPGAGPGATFFNNATRAGTAMITNDGAFGANRAAGFTTFFTTDSINPASADQATIFNRGGAQDGVGTPPGPGGVTNFLGVSTGANATITNDGGLQTSPGGSTNFLEKSTAGAATINNNGAGFNDAGGGFTVFDSTDPGAPAGAGMATINNNGGLAGNAPGGTTRFLHSTGAGNASINNHFGIGVNAGGGVTDFLDTSNANAAFLNNKGAAGSPGLAGATRFFIQSSANSATINNEPSGSGSASGFTQFLDNSSAANALINNLGGTDSDSAGGVTEFRDNSDAGNAILRTQGGINGGSGGVMKFLGLSDGVTARAITNGNSRFDISGHDAGVFSPTMRIGSIEGGGNYFLGGQPLETGGNNLSTEVSGVIQDGGLSGGVGGSLIKVGTGTLSLTNANTYSGVTLIKGGTLFAGHDGALGLGNVGLTVSGVTLTLQNGANNNYIAGGADLSIVSGSIVNLNFTGPPDIIGSLTVDGVAQAPGLYGSAASGAPHQLPQLTGTGTLLIIPVPGQLVNISTRMWVLADPSAPIGGFILTGTDKRVIIRGMGPSLQNAGIQTFLADPVLELHMPDGSVVTNDNWQETQRDEIVATGLAPSRDEEAAVVATLPAGNYTGVLTGKNGGTGIGVVEVYDLSGGTANSRLGNISTRAFVDTGDNCIIGGFIIGPATINDAVVVARGTGPSMQMMGQSALQDPTLELYNGNGGSIAFNDNWQDDVNRDSIPQSLKPTDPRESALFRLLTPGNYTAIVRGAGNTTGVGMVEVYNIQ